MSKLVSFDQRPEDRFRVDCNCGESGHSVVFELHRWEWDDEGKTLPYPNQEASAHVLDAWMTPRGWWARLRGAVALFWKGEYCRGEVGLNPEDLMGIVEWCNKALVDAGHESKSA